MFSISARFWFTDFLLAWFDVIEKENGVGCLLFGFFMTLVENELKN